MYRHSAFPELGGDLLIEACNAPSSRNGSRGLLQHHRALPPPRHGLQAPLRGLRTEGCMALYILHQSPMTAATRTVGGIVNAVLQRALRSQLRNAICRRAENVC